MRFFIWTVSKRRGDPLERVAATNVRKLVVPMYRAIEAQLSEPLIIEDKYANRWQITEAGELARAPGFARPGVRTEA